jgi:hypothetical protein
MSADTYFVGAPFSVASFLVGPSLGLLFLVWAIVATTLALRSGPMERSRVAQLYGYTVCLVSVVTILFTIPSLIDNVFRVRSPLQASRSFGGFDPALWSFDAYKATYERARSFPPRDEAPSRPPPSDEELRRQYEALRADRIASNAHEGRRELVSDLLLLALAAALFVAHWRWLRRRGDETPAAA